MLGYVRHNSRRDIKSNLLGYTRVITGYTQRVYRVYPGIPWYTLPGIPEYIQVYPGILGVPWSRAYPGIPRYISDYIPGYTQVYPGIPSIPRYTWYTRYTVVYCIPWYALVYLGTPGYTQVYLVYIDR